MKGRIDVASFTCPTCGHRSTPPEEVNAFSRQMEEYEILEAVDIPDRDIENILVQTLQEQHRGNTFDVEAIRKQTESGGNDELILSPEVEPESYVKVIKVKRSYCTVSQQSHTNLSESNHIVLNCPQCNTQLYEVHWK